MLPQIKLTAYIKGKIEFIKLKHFKVTAVNDISSKNLYNSYGEIDISFK